jgi:hypothetical protein
MILSPAKNDFLERCRSVVEVESVFAETSNRVGSILLSAGCERSSQKTRTDHLGRGGRGLLGGGPGQGGRGLVSTAAAMQTIAEDIVDTVGCEVELMFECLKVVEQSREGMIILLQKMK